MYKLGQLMLMVAVLTMITISVLLIVGLIDSKAAGGIFVIALILTGGGSGISKKYKTK